MNVFAIASTKHDVGILLLQIAITIIATLIVQFIAHEIVNRLVQRMVRVRKKKPTNEEKKREDTLVRMFRTVISALLWTIAGVVILMLLKINLAALATGAGLIGIVAGFGAQNLIKDTLAGMFIIIENQYRVGDVVTLGGLTANDGVSGVVEDISIRITRLRDLDGTVHIIPNGLAGVVSNRTFYFAQVNIDIPVNYDTDVDAAEKIINQVGVTMAADEVWKPFFIDPIKFLRVDSFNDYSITLKSLGKVQPAAQWDVSGEFRRRIKVAFETHGITIQLPAVSVNETRLIKAKAAKK